MKRGSTGNGDAKGKPGRPSKFTPDIANRIVEGLSAGTPLTILCEPDSMPGVRTVYDWAKKDAAFSADIAGAREAGFDAIAVNVRETTRGRGDSTGDVLRDKLIVEMDMKLLAKWDSKRYGDRISQEISGPDGGPIKTESKSDPEIARFAEMVALAHARIEEK